MSSNGLTSDGVMQSSCCIMLLTSRAATPGAVSTCSQLISTPCLKKTITCVKYHSYCSIFGGVIRHNRRVQYFLRHGVVDVCCVVTDARPRRLRSAETRTPLVSGTWTNYLAIEPSVQLDLESGTICRRISDSRFRESLKTFLFGQWDKSAV